MDLPNKVQLITYADSLGGNLAALADVLDEHFAGLFPGGVHVLPPFPSSGDRGFAPLTYDEIDPRLGTWDDIRRIGERGGVMLDLMVNHISARSPYFRDFLARGPDSEWADLFLTTGKIWPGGEPVEADVERLFLRRKRPWSTFHVGNPPRPARVWTTFGKTDPSEQIDMDWRSPQFRALIERFLEGFAANGVRMVRLDAVGYLAKRPGTSCFFIQPETDRILDWLDAVAAHHGIVLLPEVHAKQEIQLGLSRRGSWIYDFVLPYRILEALLLRDPADLALYLATRPQRQVTTLDCHDGVPVKPDLDGLYDAERVRQVVATCKARGGNVSPVYSPAHQDPDGFDVHQVRGTYYALVDRDDDAYIAARAIQLFAPGVPQVYYVGLLAGDNDSEAGERTGDGREINRHNYTREEIRAAVASRVVVRLERLIRLRNSHAAFDGVFEVSRPSSGRLRMVRSRGHDICTLDVDFDAMRSIVEMTLPGGARESFEL